MKFFSYVLLSLIVCCHLAVSAYAGDSDPSELRRQEEIALVWKVIMRQVKGIDAILDKMIDSKGSPRQGGRQPIRTAYGLMLDDGRLRLVNDTDRSLAPNRYLTLIYEKDHARQTWRILALDNQNGRRKVASYEQGQETIYSYDPSFHSGEIAKSAKAYRNGKLVGKAEATRRVTTTIPFQLEVQETHYNDKGDPVYEGMLLIGLGQMGTVAKEWLTSGKKKSQIFDTWATTSR